MFRKKVDIKLLICDVDGTLTDGKMNYSKEGKMFKSFNTHDANGLNIIKEKYGIQTIFLTGDNDNGITCKRAEDLGISAFYDIHNKWKFLKKHILDQFKSKNIAYIGDDVNDLKCMQNVGIAACPNNAVLEVRKNKKVINLKKNGGEGCVREFIDKYIIKGDNVYGVGRWR